MFFIRNVKPRNILRDYCFRNEDILLGAAEIGFMTQDWSLGLLHFPGCSFLLSRRKIDTGKWRWKFMSCLMEEKGTLGSRFKLCSLCPFLSNTPMLWIAMMAALQSGWLSRLSTKGFKFDSRSYQIFLKKNLDFLQIYQQPSN